MTLDPIWQPPLQQRVYRALLEAHSFPGRVIDLPVELGDQPATLAVLATLLDTSTSFCDADGLISPEDQLRLEAPSATADDADFVLFQADLAPPDGFKPRLGDVYHPHEGATLVLGGRSIVEGHTRFELSGPGVESTQPLNLTGFDTAWFAQREQWISAYPTGVDLILCDASRITAIPRTTMMRSLIEAPSTEGGRA
ncbi:phosphonate C-P lyase system protein PhnH [Algisphaera agarilytica]|nr:phosphonate C-P lyase system protein PhnH [Algisphaera agarilytica]